MGLQERLGWDVNWVKVLQQRERMHSKKAQDDLRHGGELAKGFRERGKNTVQLQSRRDQGIILKFLKCFVKNLKSK